MSRRSTSRSTAGRERTSIRLVTLAPKLLVVEDDPAIRRLIRVAAERAGHEVHLLSQ